MNIYFRYLAVMLAGCFSMLFAKYGYELLSYEDLVVKRAKVQALVTKFDSNSKFKENARVQAAIETAKEKLQELNDYIGLEELEMEDEVASAKKEADIAAKEQDRISSALAIGFGGTPEVTAEDWAEIEPEASPAPSDGSSSDEEMEAAAATGAAGAAASRRLEGVAKSREINRLTRGVRLLTGKVAEQEGRILNASSLILRLNQQILKSRSKDLKQKLSNVEAHKKMYMGERARLRGVLDSTNARILELSR